MLRDEIREVLELFDEYKISEDDQRKLFEEGLFFNFTYGDPDYQNRNQRLNVFGVAILLKTCRENNIRLNVKRLLKEPYMFQSEDLICDIASIQDQQYKYVHTNDEVTIAKLLNNFEYNEDEKEEKLAKYKELKKYIK